MIGNMRRRAEARCESAVDRRFDAVSSILLVLAVVALCIQGPTLFAVGTMDFTLGHAMVGVVGALSLAWSLHVARRLVLPPIAITVLLLLFTVITCVDAPRFGFGTTIFKYVFQYIVLTVALNLMRLLEARQAERCIRAASWVVLALVLVNACFHMDAFMEYYANPWDGHPNFGTVFSGGVNLEATWPAMLGVFMSNNRSGWVYTLLVMAFAAVVQSRAGLMLAVLAFAYVVLVKDGLRPSRRRVAVVVLTVGIAGAFSIAGPRALAIASDAGMEADASVEADSTIAADGVSVPGEDQPAAQPGSRDVISSNGGAAQDAATTGGSSPGSDVPISSDNLIGEPGRRGIWAASIQVFQDAPLLGHGAGNAMDAVRELSGFPYREDNVHNYPLQVLLDFGLVGFAVFAVVVVGFLISSVRARCESSFAAFIILYLVGSMIQFAGGELLLGFAIAGFAAFGPTMGASLRKGCGDE